MGVDNAVQMVREFHLAFGAPTGDVTPMTPDRRDLRIDLINEEARELGVAFQNFDRVGVADALADLLYVIAGTAVEMNINLECKGYGLDKYIDGDALGYLFRNLEHLSYYMIFDDSLGLVGSSLANVVVDIADASDIPLAAVFNEVHRSNMSKLNEHGQPILRADGKILKSNLYSPPNIAPLLGL